MFLEQKLKTVSQSKIFSMMANVNQAYSNQLQYPVNRDLNMQPHKPGSLAAHKARAA